MRDSSPTPTFIPTMVDIETDYLLFDLDGTLVNSTPAVEKTWHDTVERHNSQHPHNLIDPVEFLKSAHGARTVETFERRFPYMPRGEADVNEFEFQIVKNYGHLALEVSGTLPMLFTLEQKFATKWAIVTSGTRSLAHGWFEKLFGKFRKPTVFVTANDVTEGKPKPEGYLIAFNRLCAANGTSPQNSRAVVFEDAPTGIRAGVAGGFVVVGITTTFDKATLLEAGASYAIQDMLKVAFEEDGNAIKIKLDIE